MTTSSIRQKLHRYIETAQDKKVKAFYTIVENDIANEKVGSNQLLKELNRRTDDFEGGKVKGLSWTDVKRTRKSEKAKID